MTQNERILAYLRDNGSITPLEAMERFGIMRLGARIYDLRKQGLTIKKETEKGRNRFGEQTQFARYRLEEN